MVQNFAIKEISSFLSSEWNTTVSVGSVDVKFFKSIIIYDLYVEDQRQDTLAFISRISGTVNTFSKKKRQLVFSGIELYKPHVELKRYKDGAGNNLQFILEYFKTEPVTAETKAWDVSVKNILVREGIFSFDDERKHRLTNVVDFDHIRAENLNLVLQNLRSDADTVFFFMKHISLAEQGGFRLNDFSSDVKIASDRMEFNALDIKTPHSHLITDFGFRFENFSDFDAFEKKVVMSSDFKKSTLGSNDIACFAEEVKGLDKIITIEGKVIGPLSSLKSKSFNILYGNNSEFSGSISMTGLPDFEETFMELRIKKASTGKSDLETIPRFPFTGKNKITLPRNIEQLGIVTFKGNFTGFWYDFVAFGNVTTSLGRVGCDINIKVDEKTEITTYNGKLSAGGFDLGKLAMNEKLVGKSTFDVEIKGRGFSLSTIDSELKGTVSSFHLNGYAYSNITLDGFLKHKIFTGKFLVDDPNIGLQFDGKLNLSGKIPSFDFTAAVQRAKLATINLVKRDSSSALSAVIKADATGLKLDDLEGRIHLNEISYTERGNTFSSGNILLVSGNPDGKKVLTLRSDIVDADISGNLRMTSLFNDLGILVSECITLLPTVNKRISDGQNFSYAFNFKNTRLLTSVIFPFVDIGKATNLSGTFNSVSREFTANLVSDSVLYFDHSFGKINLQSSITGNSLSLQFHTGTSTIAKIPLFGATGITLAGNRDSLVFNLDVEDRKDTMRHAHLSGKFSFQRIGSTLLTFRNSEFCNGNEVWRMERGNFILFDSVSAMVRGVTIANKNQKVSVEGIISRIIDDQLNFTFTEFNVEQLNGIFRSFGFETGGIINGKVIATRLFTDMRYSAQLTVDDMRLFDDTLGDAAIAAVWNNRENKLEVDAAFSRNELKNIEVKGEYSIEDGQENLDFDINITKTYIKEFGHYLESFSSDVRGILTAGLHLGGSFAEPELTGKVLIQKGSLLIDYLNTRYTFTHEFEVSANYFSLDNLVLNDESGKQALVQGKIYHDHLRDFSLDLAVRPKRTQVLNTKSYQNEIFYGTAYASGLVRIDGPFDNISIETNLKSEKGTHIYIPLTNPEEVTGKKFITFLRSPDDTSQIFIEKETSLTGIEMMMELDITTDAEIDLIFDEKVGDVIKGTGNGNIRMEISQTGDFTMFGTYTIASGDYLFTMQNVINKKFLINPGSTIRWNGDPYDADINIAAVYKARAALKDLLLDTTDAYRRRIPVDLKLTLTDKLFKPAVHFEIDIPNLDAGTQSRVQALINSEQETNKQVFYLLALNKFATPSETQNQPQIATGDVVGSNVSELLSAQLSQWASQISDKFDVGVNYRSADALNSEELELMLSTNLFNDRVTIESNVGVTGNNTGSQQNTSNLVGDFNVEVKASKDGRLKVKAFNKSNTYDLTNASYSNYKQGVGLSFRQEFNRFTDLFRKKKKKETENEKSVGELKE